MFMVVEGIQTAGDQKAKGIGEANLRRTIFSIRLGSELYFGQQILG